MAFRLATAADRTALQALRDGRLAERLADYGSEISFAELVQAWVDDKLEVVVDEANNGTLRGACVVWRHVGRLEILVVWVPAGIGAATVRDRIHAIVKFAAQRLPQFLTMTFEARLKAGGSLDNHFAPIFPTQRIVRGTWAVYYITGAEMGVL